MNAFHHCRKLVCRLLLRFVDNADCRILACSSLSQHFLLTTSAASSVLRKASHSGIGISVNADLFIRLGATTPILLCLISSAVKDAQSVTIRPSQFTGSPTPGQLQAIIWVQAPTPTGVY
jgi:hypothetical protein